MKRLFFTFLTCALVFSTLSASRIVNINKNHGGLFGYDRLEQHFNGFDQHGNTYWSLSCTDPGFTRCRLDPTGIVVSEDPSNDDVTVAEVNSTNSAIEWLEGELDSTPSGSTVKHYVVTLPDNTIVDVYVHLTWEEIQTDEFTIVANSYHVPR